MELLAESQPLQFVGESGRKRECQFPPPQKKKGKKLPGQNNVFNNSSFLHILINLGMVPKCDCFFNEYFSNQG